MYTRKHNTTHTHTEPLLGGCPECVWHISDSVSNKSVGQMKTFRAAQHKPLCWTDGWLEGYTQFRVQCYFHYDPSLLYAKMSTLCADQKQPSIHRPRHARAQCLMPEIAHQKFKSNMIYVYAAPRLTCARAFLGWARERVCAYRSHPLCQLADAHRAPCTRIVRCLSRTRALERVVSIIRTHLLPIQRTAVRAHRGPQQSAARVCAPTRAM